MASHAPTFDTLAKPPVTALSGKLTLFAAALLVALQIELLFAKSVNWDEFFHFSQIHASLRGEPVQWLQTPHVYLFSLVPSLPGSPIDHILLTRILILPFAVVTCLAIYDIARRFADEQSAALAALAFAGGGNVFMHAFALRADMIAAALLTGALWILITRSRSIIWVGAAAALCGIAAIATIKSVLYAPALIAAAAWRWRGKIGIRAVTGMLLLGLAVAMAAFALAPAEITQSIKGLARSSANRMFSAGVFPQGHHFITQLAIAPILTGFVVLAFIKTTTGNCRMPFWLVLGLVLPLASIIIYRNAYPYYYAFILPPVAIVAALGVQPIVERYGARIVLGGIVLNALILSVAEERDMLDRQRIVQSGISEIFPEPVRYIDDIAFRPDFPRAVPHFASGWALENYHRRGELVYTEAMKSAPTPFLFRQGYALEVLEPVPGDEAALLPEDAAALQGNYIQHWGRVFVAGKHIEPSDTVRSIVLAVPGRYTVEGGDITLDGVKHAAGSVVVLGRDAIEIGPNTKTSTLRWGDALPIPATPFPTGQLFTNY
ncbi:hypothetical protein QWY75_06735 [Pontixanthobacter aestiaquae]|uniref:Dolichyl-phosphate-mannose-protein mannosyltransferase n=1 Tax=Pontixanthobacter aestiaquae TaxID=1509367 RepID=A0A844ZB87_9SPHN|nr:hypothetical protein [Pontixanthobacter aestiaquae]MDN3645897.1 hypothetical protein [Pontixanthobacter aestiaquae]MXO83109.1 hypothetical protein [Pontixanthobacter aestiaquae]